MATDEELSSALFGGNSNEEPESTPTEPTEPKPVDTPVQPTEEEKQAKHWQRIATKKDEELKRLQSQLEEATKPKEPEQQAPKRPVLPARPANYNRLEAVSDETSASAKYDDAMDEYRRAKDAYEAWKEDRDDRLREQEVASRKQAAEQQRLYEQGIADFMSIGKTEEEAKAIMQWASKTTFNAETYSKLYDLMNKPGQQPKANRQNVPPPPGRAGADAETPNKDLSKAIFGNPRPKSYL